MHITNSSALWWLLYSKSLIVQFFSLKKLWISAVPTKRVIYLKQKFYYYRSVLSSFVTLFVQEEILSDLHDVHSI